MLMTIYTSMLVSGLHNLLPHCVEEDKRDHRSGCFVEAGPGVCRLTFLPPDRVASLFKRAC